MIPRAFITEWSAVAPWPQEAHVEQDLVITRALVEIFGDRDLAEFFGFRGGTALSKLFFRPAHRYSEDIDLVQLHGSPIGEPVKRIRAVLDWLGEPKYASTERSTKLIYRFESELESPPRPLRLKIEINTREHFSVFPMERRHLECRSEWFNGDAEVTTFALDELLGTKLRALYQRKKGRDLFDVALALRTLPVVPGRIVRAFNEYMERGGHTVTRRAFEQNLGLKLDESVFTDDVGPLSREGAWDHAADARLVSEELIARLE